MTKSSHDLVIVGGGLVGASLALAASRLGLDVAVVERVPFRASSSPSYDDRTLALNHASCRILAALDLWPALAPSATPIREVTVTDLGRPGRVVLRPEEVGQEWFGQVVEARAFGAAIIEALEQSPVDLVCPGQVTALEVQPGRVRLVLDQDGEVVERHARLLVAADGADSFVRTALGIGARRHDYGQVAIIANVTPADAHRGRAWERFTPTGPVALLPHQGERCGLVWCTTDDRAEDLLALSDSEFMAAAGERAGHPLGALRRLGRRSAYPLKLVVADTDVAERAVVIGNAAHAIHPVGAQGFNLGLRDVATLAELLDEAPGADPGAPELVARYHGLRRADHSGTIGYSDGLARAWSNPSLVAGVARTAGLVAHALVPPLRRQLLLRAMGYRGRTPAMALAAGALA